MDRALKDHLVHVHQKFVMLNQRTTAVSKASAPEAAISVDKWGGVLHQEILINVHHNSFYQLQALRLTRMKMRAC